MPAMYPEQLRTLREQNPGLQYDFRGNVIGATPPDSVQMAADAIYQLPGMQPNAWDFGPTRADFQNSSEFIGPLQPQWWDPNGELAQRGLGALVAGQDLQQRPAVRPQNPYVPRQRTFDQSSDGLPGIAESPDELSNILLQANQMPIMQPAASEVRYANPPAMLPPELRYQPMSMHEQHMRANTLLGGNPYGLSRSPLGRAADWMSDTGRRAAEAQDWVGGVD